MDPGPLDPRGNPSVRVALAFLGAPWEAWGLSPGWLHLTPRGVQTARAVLGTGFARTLSHRVVKSSEGAAHLPASASAARVPAARPVRWATEGKACSYARASTEPESNPDITGVSEMGVRAVLIVP